MQQMIRRRVLISGRVQNVGFRMATLHQVRKKKAIVGYVRNLSNGKVEAVFQREPSEIQSLINWCKEGPSGARVDGVEVHEEPVDEELDEFEIR